MSKATEDLCREASEYKDAEIARLHISDRGLRRRVHQLEGHNQHFERCESHWCHPSQNLSELNADPARDIGIPEQWPCGECSTVPPAIERLRQEVADLMRHQLEELKSEKGDLTITHLKRQLAEGLALVREHGFGENSPDIEDAIRQVLQAAIANAGNVKTLKAQVAEARADTERLDWLEGQKITEWIKSPFRSDDGKKDYCYWSVSSHAAESVRDAIDLCLDAARGGKDGMKRK